MSSNKELIPRAYQEEIFQEACKSNVICASPTGSGKTFIAVLLIRWITSHEQQNGRKVIFIVPKVPLVNQQASVLQRHTPLRVKGYCGEMGVDLWDVVQWQREFADHDVLVMTAQILLNLLTHAQWAMSKISLLIFDEVHHCRKNSPYNRIMQDYYRNCPSASCPKIFGMTASPIYSPDKAERDLSELEANTYSKVIAVRLEKSKNELAQHSPRPQEALSIYPPARKNYPEHPSLWRDMMNVGLWITEGLDLQEVETKYYVALEALGPLGADHYLFSYLDRRVKELKNSHVGIASYCISEGSSIVQTTPTHRPRANLEHVRRILESYRPVFGTDIPVIDKEYLSPKVINLATLLLSRKTSTFQGIVFVEQRHVTVALSWLLSGISELSEWLKCAPFVGHGSPSTSKTVSLGSSGMTFKLQNNVVQQFRDSTFNLLIATSVAEEGLDFQACHLIVRFDGLKTMVGYVQSRGRARRPDSTYIVMIEENSTAELDKYYQLIHSERALDKMYQRAEEGWNVREVDSDPEDDDGSVSERYVVKSTGATLTSHSAIPLLNYLCSIIPRDEFCPYIKPEYTVTSVGSTFVATVKLPSVLPLRPSDKEFQGAICGSRKGAKRAAAFQAARRLHQLEVFDDNLLPGRLQRGDGAEDADGNPVSNTFDIPKVMEAPVFHPWADLWRDEAEVWLHPLYVDGKADTGLVAGRNIETFRSEFHTPNGSYQAFLGEGIRLQWPTPEARRAQLHLMESYSISTIWWTVSISAMPTGQSFFLVPLQGNSPDYRKMMSIMEDATSLDWSDIGSEHENSLIVMDRSKNGHIIYLFKKFRTDITPLSKPQFSEGEQVEKEYESYLDYFNHRMAKMKYRIPIEADEPMLELQPIARARNMSSTLDRLRSAPPKIFWEERKKDVALVPRSLCRWIRISMDIFRAMQMLPAVTRHVTDLSRAHSASKILKLPPVPDDLLVEALTLPSAMTGFSYQRLETLGDAVLKLATSVHVFNKYPHRHEGQLDILRMNSINNLYLLARGRDCGLERFLNAEPVTIKNWKPETGTDVSYDENGEAFVQRSFARRSLPDCVEALLGASFLSGGTDSVLQTGSALGLCVGGPEPWHTRYKSTEFEGNDHRTLFSSLEEVLGYHFRNSQYLLEAVSHPSFLSTETASYQRFEFLGDALLDLYVTNYLFLKYPDATPGQITWAKSRGVCNPSLAAASVKCLHLHRYSLYTSAALGAAVAEAEEMLESISYKEIVGAAWKLDPPKVLADLLEAVMGAVLVDSGYDMERTFEVVDRVMKGLLEVIYVGMPKDPITELMIFVARAGCRKVNFRKSRSRPELVVNDSVSVQIHGTDIAGPCTGPTLSLSKYMVAERALQLLRNPDDPESQTISNLCDCQQEREKERAESEERLDLRVEPPGETAEEFARSADALLGDLGTTAESEDAEDDESAIDSATQA